MGKGDRSDGAEPISELRTPISELRREAPPTGFAVARRAGVPVIIGDANCYHWWRKVIVLRESVAAGSGAFQQLCAAHEAAHHAQNLAMPWLRWFEPVRWWSEFDAWRRAVESLA